MDRVATYFTFALQIPVFNHILFLFVFIISSLKFVSESQSRAPQILNTNPFLSWPSQHLHRSHIAHNVVSTISARATLRSGG